MYVHEIICLFYLTRQYENTVFQEANDDLTINELQ